jgi:superfamily II DNA or RNA helicase
MYLKLILYKIEYKHKIELLLCLYYKQTTNRMETIHKEVLLKRDPGLEKRPYQLEALLSIFLYAKCLVKMFCGTGKSRIITNVIIHEKKGLSVVVFPSLALISQYSTDYLNNEEYARHFKNHKMKNVSSEKLDNMASTTDEKEIKKFLKYKNPKIILVTYQSYQVLLDCLEGKKIGLVCYDEAHHVVSPETQKLVFGTDYYEKEVFFTATPKNENGITMFDRDDIEKNMCGPVAYDYTYLQGLVDEVLNAFEICIDMYTENTNASIYEAMARAILARNTSRVLSFHSGVNGESNTNVWNFVNQAEFQSAFTKVQKAEFPEKDYYTKITFKGMDGNTPPSVRKAMLKALDDTPDNEIYIIASCETIGEGVDTKKANMCLFADPKSSVTKIIQNIGRVVRRNKAHPLSTILIPCWVNMENYAAANGDRAKQDELIRQQMRSEKGDYASILNVLGALRQEDPEFYEMCLDYSDSREDESEADFDEEESVSEADTESDDAESVSASEAEADTEDRRQPKRIRMSIHQNDDIQMLWGMKGELDFSQKFCSVVIECAVVKIDQMELAIGIIERANARVANGLNLLPHFTKNNTYEWTDAGRLGQWRQYLKGNKTTHKLQDNVKIYLDESLSGWSDEIDDKQMKRAKEIVSRAKRRMKKLKTLIPVLPILIGNPINEEQEQECKDAGFINTLKQIVKGQGKKRISLLAYLDKELPGWNNSLEEKALDKAKAIVSRANARDELRSNFIPISIYQPKNDVEIQEVDDAMILGMWKGSLKGKGSSNLYESVKIYLDQHLKGWCDEYSALNQAKEIVLRAKEREKNGGHLFPKDYHISKSKEAKKIKDLDIFKKIEESQDACKLNQWCISINGGLTTSVCPDDVRKYLDKELPGWNSTLDEDAMKHVVELVKRANLRKLNGGKLLPTRHDKKNEPDDRTDNEKQQDKDSKRLSNLNNSLSGKSKGRCSNDICIYLDKEIPGWREPKKRTKKQTAIPIETTTATETTTPHHFPPPSEIGLLHKTYLKMRSDTLNAKFKDKPQLWREYHATRKRNFAAYDPASIPSNKIIRELEKIQTKRRKVVVDMGCGEAPIAHHFQNDLRFTFHNYDHQSGGDPLIQEVDISALPLDDADAEIAIMSLALWGTHENCVQYIKEAYRILESGGKFYISDSTKKWSPENPTQENGGDLLRTLLTTNGFKIINEVIGTPFCFFECNKMY